MYTTVKELHIGLDIALQYIASSRNKVIKPEEKDWILNESLLELINTKINPKSNVVKEGAEDTQKRTDELAAIKSQFVTLPCYNYQTNTVYSLLPSDYFRLISDESILAYNCNGLSTLTTANVNTCMFIYEWFEDADIPAYKPFTIKTKDLTLFNISDYNVGNLYTKETKYIIIQLILKQLNKNDKYQVYWENYNNTYYQNSLIFVGDCTYLNGLNIVSGKNNSNEIKPSYIINSTYTYNTDVILRKPNRLSKSEFEPNMLDSHYFNTSHRSPISYIEGSKLVVCHNSKFKPTSIVIQYYKRPRIISLNLNQTLQLPELSEELVNLACQKFKARINDVNYSYITKENQIKE